MRQKGNPLGAPLLRPLGWPHKGIKIAGIVITPFQIDCVQSDMQCARCHEWSHFNYYVMGSEVSRENAKYKNCDVRRWMRQKSAVTAPRRPHLVRS